MVAGLKTFSSTFCSMAFVNSMQNKKIRLEAIDERNEELMVKRGGYQYSVNSEVCSETLDSFCLCATTIF